MSEWIVNKIIREYGANSYLEIDIAQGAFFSKIKSPINIAVGYKKWIDFANNEDRKYFLFNKGEDNIFSEVMHDSGLKNIFIKNETLSCDIIHINDVHLFKETLNNFKKSLEISHENTIFIINNTIPNDPFSSISNKSLCIKYRKSFNMKDLRWHGDVYKSILAIHDIFPEISYCTVVDDGNPYTILWKAPKNKRRSPIFQYLNQIDAVDYFYMLNRPELFVPVTRGTALEIIGASLNPVDYKDDDTFKRICYSPIIPNER